jgi:hypothetical protein
MKRVIARRWGYVYGSWFMVQWSLDGTLSLGIHIDPVRRGDYGPYGEVHLVVGAISVGRNPARANNHSLMRPGLMEGK